MKFNDALRHPLAMSPKPSTGSLFGYLKTLWSEAFNNTSLFTIIRYVTPLSFILLALAATSMVFTHRHFATQQMIDLVESRNTVLVQSLTNALQPQFSIWSGFEMYLQSANQLSPAELVDHPIFDTIDSTIRKLTKDLPVIKAKIYNLDGLTIYSTDLKDIGQRKANNEAFFKSAKENKPVSYLTHKDTFTAITGPLTNLDIVETYASITTPYGTIQAVMEIYSDVTMLRNDISRSQTRLTIDLLLEFSLFLLIGFIIVRYLNRTLVNQYHQLERTNQELDQFAYVASHDLKAPLRAIANLSEWIEEDLASGNASDTNKHLHLMRNRVQRMEGLIDGLLQYSRAGRTKVTLEMIDTNELVHSIIEDLAIPESLTITVQQPMPILQTARLPLQQVLSNLLDNAIKYHDKGDGWITINAQAKNNYYEFTVTDNGPGIAPQYHEKIFMIFQTLAPRDQIEGTGIGLSLVKKLVEAQGGTITLESDVDKGAIFRFTWPKAFIA